MNQTLITEQLDQWLQEFVEQPNPKLGEWAPCPYARQARINNKISIKFCEVFEFTDVIRESFLTLEQKDVVVICFDHIQIDPVSLQEYVAGINKTLMPINYVILEDHPDSPEFINGVKMNFGHCGLLILQKLDKLNTAADQLREKGYYNTWSKENLDDVIRWRYDICKN
jgi:hypothetical protein